MDVPHQGNISVLGQNSSMKNNKKIPVDENFLQGKNFITGFPFQLFPNQTYFNFFS